MTPKTNSDEEKRNGKIGCLALLAVVVFLIFLIPTPKKTPEDTRLDQIKKCFSLDGSHREITAYLKKTMDDPESFHHNGTRYIDEGEHLTVFTNFSGKNLFGGVVKNWIEAKTNIKTCDIIEIAGTGRGSAW